MRRLLPALVLLGPASGLAQTPGAVESLPDARVVQVRHEPDRPGFGEAFLLEVTLRVGSRVVAFLPDTLIPTETAESAGLGGWRSIDAPGDSIDVVATYPVIGFREGLVEYPWMELGFEARPGEGAPPIRALAEFGESEFGRPPTWLLRLGGLDVGPLEPLEAEGFGASPRPPADVLGSAWSVWRALAVGIFSMMGAVGLGLAARWAWVRANRVEEGPRLSARDEALQELERIRTLGRHRNGHLDEFYASTGDALRRFVGALEPDWGLHLTSSELMDEVVEHWGTSGDGTLVPVIQGGERVKFGRDRPDPERAERDWAAVRDWIRERPEGGERP